jgi:hypothetical protein
MSYTYKIVFVIITLGVVLSFHDTYWPWAMVPLVLSALVGAIGLRLGGRGK